MKMHLYNKTGWCAVVAALFAVFQVHAADLAGASGTLAEIGVLLSQASAGLADAGASGDVGRIADAQKRANAIKAAMDKAEAAFNEAANAVSEEAANDALKLISQAFNEAYEALNGAVPKPSKDGAHEQWKESKKNTGGGPYGAWLPPTKRIDPNGGDSDDFGDNDATPE